MRGNHHKITIAKRIEKLLANIEKTSGLPPVFAEGKINFTVRNCNCERRPSSQ
jgi:hypothetical protein